MTEISIKTEQDAFVFKSVLNALKRAQLAIDTNDPVKILEAVEGLKQVRLQIEKGN